MAMLIDNKDTKLYTTAHQNRGKETVILLHGGPGVPNGLHPVAEFLSKNFQVISFHQRGTLKSPCTSHDYSIERYLSDIDSIAAFFKLDKFHLFGHSWGGLYAQIYAQKNPDRVLSLFLCGPGSGTGKQWAETMVEVAKFNKSKSSFPELVAIGINSFLGGLGSNKAYQRLFRIFSLNFNKGYEVVNPIPFQIECIKAKPVNHTAKSLLQYPVLQEVPNPSYKVTVAYGDDDIYGDSKKYVQQRYPTAQITFIPNSSHLPWLHNEKAFYSLLADHFDIGSALH